MGTDIQITRAKPSSYIYKVDGQEVTPDEFVKTIQERMIFRAKLLAWLDKAILDCEDNDLPTPQYWAGRIDSYREVQAYLESETVDD